MTLIKFTFIYFDMYIQKLLAANQYDLTSQGFGSFSIWVVSESIAAFRNSIWKGHQGQNGQGSPIHSVWQDSVNKPSSCHFQAVQSDSLSHTEGKNVSAVWCQHTQLFLELQFQDLDEQHAFPPPSITLTGAKDWHPGNITLQYADGHAAGVTNTSSWVFSKTPCTRKTRAV